MWLYLNEPRGMMPEFFANHPDIAGVSDQSRGTTALCSSTPAVRRFLAESTEHVFRNVPELAGAVSITMSENLTNCHSCGKGHDCPRCADRSAPEVVAEVNRIISEGLRRGNPNARLIVWDWAWDEEWACEAIELLPPDVIYQCVSEWSLPIERGGVESEVGEYAISAPGPGPRAARHWAKAKERGLPTCAKTQMNNTWEMSAVPYLPTAGLIAEHCENLANAGVDGLMLGWTLGGYPSPNLDVAAEFYWGEFPTADEALRRVIAGRYGTEQVEAGFDAWGTLSEALRDYPFDIGVVYRCPVQFGPANPLHPVKTGRSSTMIGMPYDDVDGWRSIYPAETFADLFAKMAGEMDRGARMLDELAGRLPEQPPPAAPASDPDLVSARAHRRLVERDRDVAATTAIHFASVANQVRFVLARDALASTTTAEQAGPILTSLEKLIGDELDLALRLHDIACRDSRTGYEASNHAVASIRGDKALRVVRRVLYSRLDCRKMLRVTDKRADDRQLSN